MNSPLARRFGLVSLLKFAAPNMVMMLFLSLYTVVDGMFVSRLVGTTALSAVNMVYPLLSVQIGLSIMIGTGGSAIIARKLGEGREAEARQDLSFLILMEALCGLAVCLGGNLFLEPLVRMMGASPAQMADSLAYARLNLTFAPALFLQTAFQTFFVTAGRPGLGLAFTALAGLANMALDWLFMGPLGMGVAGAALATAIGWCIPAAAGLLYFSRPRRGGLYFVRPKALKGTLLHSCGNGSSEMVTNLANAITTFLFNGAFLHYYGEDGVAAVTIVLYFQFLFSALLFGYSGGVAPVVSFKYGQGDRAQLKDLLLYSLGFMGAGCLFTYLFSRAVIGAVLTAFTPAGSPVYAITIQGFPIFALSFLLMGLGIFGSSFFTALSDGFSSAVISFARTFFFLAGSILLLPRLMGQWGLWWAVPLAEALGVAVALYFLIRRRRAYWPEREGE